MLTRIEDGPVATVYSGLHNGVPVALKVFPKRFDKRTMSAFTKEQQRLSTVRRVPSILMVDGVTETPSGEPALRMELCTQSLTGLVERVGALAASDVVVLGRAIALALAAAHSAGVVHGGIAPNNVLFRATGEPAVADFGVTLRHAFTRDPLHAIEYLPPETLRDGTLNEATDLYGLGAVLHFALSGRSPHPGRLGEQPGERVLRILGEPIPALNRPDVPVQLSTLVARLLSAAADRRPPNAAQVADQLTALLPNPPKPPTPDSWDDFDTSAPPLPTHPQPEDFDDFAHPGTPPRGSRPSPPRATPHHTAQPHPIPSRPPAPHPPLPHHPPQPPAHTQHPVPAHAQYPAPAHAQHPAPASAQLATTQFPAIHPPPTPNRAPGHPPVAQPTPFSHPAPPPATTPPATPPAQATTPASPAPDGPPAQISPAPQETATTAPESPRPAKAEVTPQPAQTPLADARLAQEGLASQPPADPIPVLLPTPMAPTDASPASAESVPPAQAGPASRSAAPAESVPPARVGPALSPALMAPIGLPPVGPVVERSAETVEVVSHASVVRPEVLGTGMLPLASLVPAPSEHDGVLRPDMTPTTQLPTPATVEFAAQRGPGVVVSRPAMDGDDEFADFADPVRVRGQAKVLAGPLAPPDRAPKRLVRYDLLAGAALLLAMVALVPLFLLRGDPEEMSSSPRLPQAGGSSGGDVVVELAEPVDLTDKVRLTWTASRDLDFAVAIAAEGEETRVVLAERNRSMTVDVKPGVKYCFEVRASEGAGEEVYVSDPVGLRGATCRR